MLTHNTSTVIVFQSIEYRNFSMINGNRSLNEKKINKIVKEIERGNDMLMYYPIQVRVVGEKLEILDGQHRFFISKKLKRPVHYIMVSEDKSMSDIAKVNSNVEKWKPTDFINCYVQQQNPAYIKLKEFLDTYDLSVSISIRLLDSGAPGAEGTNKTVVDKFENGTFQINHWDNAVRIAEMCKRFDILPFWRDRSFIIAVYRIEAAALIAMGDLVTAVKNSPKHVSKQANYKTYVNNLEMVFNKGKHNRIVIL